MKKKFVEGKDWVFDGFAERNYREDTDGWLNELASESEYPCVTAARDVIEMFNEIQALRKENWELKKQLKLWRK